MVGPQLLELVMGVRILLPEHFLIQVIMHLEPDKSQYQGDLFRNNPKTPTQNGSRENESKIFLW